VLCPAPTFPPQRGIAVILHHSDHEVIPSCRNRVRQRAAASASRAGAMTALHQVVYFVEMTKLCETHQQRACE